MRSTLKSQLGRDATKNHIVSVKEANTLRTVHRSGKAVGDPSNTTLNIENDARALASGATVINRVGAKAGDILRHIQTDVVLFTGPMVNAKKFLSSVVNNVATDGVVTAANANQIRDTYALSGFKLSGTDNNSHNILADVKRLLAGKSGITVVPSARPILRAIFR